MQSLLRSRSLLLVALVPLAGGPSLFGQGTAASNPTGGSPDRKLAPFRVLDNVEGALVDLLFAPVRPLLLDESSNTLYVLNTHDSRLVEYDTATGAVRQSAPLPWGPVSLAAWPGNGELGPSLLVACRGSHVLARLDRASLEIVGLVDLPNEPADVVVHPTSNHAFVSCAGADRVVEVDLGESSIVHEYPILSKEPTFLALDGERVLVAPRLSGNNSVTDTGPNLLDQGDGRVLDLEDPLIATQKLPDHDVFGIVPGSDAVPLARDMGAVLFALGINPMTGLLWQLGTEANNKDPLRMGEPAIRGDIIFNQLSFATLPPQGGPVVDPLRVFVLDDADRTTAGIQYDPAMAVGQPYALAFDAAGNGYITGMLTDNVTELAPMGGFKREWDVGSIPRGIAVDSQGSSAWVLCWGTNTIEKWDVSLAAPALVQTLDVGFDPTPPPIAEGRRIFYDAGHSMHGNASCATCHVDGSTDMLPWDLSGLPFDDKGPLITQTLVGIADLLPYHWRGERVDLIDFNPAFNGLLGGTPLDESAGGEFDLFQEFLFSLQQPANPNEDPRRMVNASLGFRTPDGAHHEADGIKGQDVFFDVNSDIIGSCSFCHTLPTGSSNDVVLDDPNLPDAYRNHKEVASFNGIWRKESPTLETVIYADGSSEERPTIGSAMTSAGLVDSLKQFVDIPLFTLNATQRAQVTAFVNQVDSGLAPAVHRAWFLQNAGAHTTYGVLRGYLLTQAKARNVDIAVFGEVDLGAGLRRLRWTWDRATQLFRAEDSQVAPQPLEFFYERALAGMGRFTFLGLPVGMAERFAIDYDEDDLPNVDEGAWGADPYVADTDGDGEPDGHEVAHGGDPNDNTKQGTDGTPPVISNVRVVYATTRVAKILFETDEPAGFDIAWVSGSVSGSASEPRPETTHTALLRGLVPNRAWTVTLTATDVAGNLTVVNVPGVHSQAVVIPIDTSFQDAGVTVTQNTGGTLRFQVSGRAARKGGGNASGMQLRVQVYVNGVLTQPQVNGSVSGGTGITTVDVVQNGLSPGDEVVANVKVLWNVQGGGPFLWSMPDTPPQNRKFAVTYTGP
jgi:hypothetical protein